MKTTLLIDINDTLDDGSDFAYRENMSLDVECTWVLWPRKWIENFSDFLVEYKEKLLPIFWTSVWLYGQDFVAKQWLKTEIIWFDGKDFIPLPSSGIFSPSYPWIGTPKSSDIPTLREYIKDKSEHIIWFEDWLNRLDQNFVDTPKDVDYISVNQIDTLTSKIPEIIRLIK